MTDLNPQEKYMADESMIRTLDAQARAIWPQEVELIRRYGLEGEFRILDAGCGSGEISSRLADFYPRATVVGVDVLQQQVELARSRYTRLAPRLSFQEGSVFGLEFPDRSFDLTVCRHVDHSVPHADRVFAELGRVTKRGGRLHLISEDYGMIHFRRGALDPREFWHEAAPKFGEATGTDLFIGRHSYGILKELGFTDIAVDYVIVDTLRVPRETFAAIFEAWRDGYAESVAEITRFTREESFAYFEAMIANIRDPNGYAVWFVPVISAKVS